MAFDWQRFLDNNRIDYVTQGNNVAQGNINVKCPFCGVSDPSEHMGLNIANGAWGCWRDEKHRGRKPHKLIMELLNCSYQHAATLAGHELKIDLGKFESFVAQFRVDNLGHGTVQTRKTNVCNLKFPYEFLKLNKKNKDLGKKFIKYLVTRGFERKEVMELAKTYNLHYCLLGEWQHRIIIPVYFHNEMVCWTSRSVYPDEKLRYKTLHTAEAIMNIKHTMFNFDAACKGGRILYITEGPFDAMKVDFYGKEYGIRSTCTYGLEISEPQIYLINEMKQFFNKVYLLYDRSALAQSFKTKSKLIGIIDKYIELPDMVDDPGNLTKSQINKYLLDD